MNYSASPLAIGIFAFFTNDALNRWLSIDVNWLLIALVGILAIAVFGYFDISIAAAFLGVTLIAAALVIPPTVARLLTDSF